MTQVTLFVWAILAFQLEVLPGRCVSVVDGDTIDVVSGGKTIRIRLEGIDCPEGGQDFGDQAKGFISNLALGKDVTIVPKETDDYGRLVARVFAGGTDLSISLLRAGLAWHFKKYSSDWLLSRLEQKARAEKMGLWATSDAIPPWDYRSGIRAIPTVQASESKPSVAGAVTQQYHGNVNSRVFHSPSCRSYSCKNCTRVFQSREEAIAAGFKPCGICRP